MKIKNRLNFNGGGRNSLTATFLTLLPFKGGVDNG